MSIQHLTEMTPEERQALTQQAQEAQRKTRAARARLGKQLVPLLLATESGKKYPALARRAAEGSIRAAVTLQCTECMGGVRNDAKACETRHCPLWLHGPAGRLAVGDVEDETAESDVTDADGAGEVGEDASLD